MFLGEVWAGCGPTWRFGFSFFEMQILRSKNAQGGPRGTAVHAPTETMAGSSEATAIRELGSWPPDSGPMPARLYLRRVITIGTETGHSLPFFLTTLVDRERTSRRRFTTEPSKPRRERAESRPTDSRPRETTSRRPRFAPPLLRSWVAAVGTIRV